MKKNLFFLALVLVFFVSGAYTQNNCLEFDGTDDYVDCGTINLSGTSLTLECWINADDFINPGHGCISLIGTEDGNGNTALLRLGDGNVNLDKVQFVLEIGGNQRKLWANTTLLADTWYHIVGVYNSTGMEIYINGVSDNSNSQSGSVTSNGPFLIGDIIAYGTGVREFHGKIDEVRIWNDARSEAEIRQNMYRELTDPSGEANLLAYYKLNETSGATATDSKGSNNGTLNNYGSQSGYWQTSPAMFGPKNCLDFDGSNDWINTSVTMPSVYTKEAWVFIASANDLWNNIVSGGNLDGTHVLWIPKLYSYKLSAGNSAPYDAVQDPTVFPFGSWQHVAVTYASDGTMTLYRNGVQVDQANGVPAFTGTTVRIGAFDDNSNHLGGRLDEVRIWSDVRTEDEIREYMCKSLSGNEENLIAYYNFDNTSGTALQDFSGNGNDGILYNMANNDWISSSAFNIWLNTSSSSWSTATNWSLGVPSSGDNVSINDFTTDPVIASGTGASCNNLTVNSGATLTINSGGSLITNGIFSGSQSINVQQAIADDGKWHFISMPNNTTTANTFYNMYLQQWVEGDGTEAGWQDISDPESILAAAQGYSLWVPGGSKMNFTYTGVPNTGDQNIAITANGTGTNKWMNFVGNPYPSYLDWQAVAGYGSKYTWNGTAYLTYTQTGGYGEGSRYVAPMEGFFIYKDLSTPDNFTLTNAMRTHTSSKESGEEHNLKNGLILTATNGSYHDALWIILDETASEAFEPELDAWKLLSSTTGLSQLWTETTSGKLSVDVRSQTGTIQLGFTNDQPGIYTISIREIVDIPEAYLEDTKTNTFHNLQTSDYNFSWEPEIDPETRFKLHLNAVGIEETPVSESNILIYAANNQIFIKGANAGQVRVCDLMGRIVLEQEITSSETFSIPVTLQMGVYVVTVQSGDEIKTEKIFIN